MWELRPDLSFFSVDIAGPPARMPPNASFALADLESQKLPWADRSFDSITCMHLIEHLRTSTNLWREAARLLKPAGRIYLETPGVESLKTTSAPPPFKGRVTLNFFDDPTHIDPVPIDALARAARDAGLRVTKTGRSRNWIFVLAYPLLLLLPVTRQRYVARLHWLGWSVYLIAEKPLAW
jgi:SAM-dependent methyltransferase